MATSDKIIGPDSGSFGGMTVYEMNGKLVWRTKRGKPAHPTRTELAMNQRCKMANVTGAWRQFRGSLKDNFELRKPGQTDYNAFVSVNLSNARVYLTHQEADQHICVADNFVLSQGTLKPDIEVGEREEFFLSNISVGELNIDRSTTIGELSAALIANNNGLWLSGDELLFYANLPNELDYVALPGHPFPKPAPVTTMKNTTCLRITLDYGNTSPLPPVFIGQTFCTLEGRLAVLRWGGMLGAWVHRRRDSKGHIITTSQHLVGLNPGLTEYTTSEARDKAMESYGVNLIKPARALFATPSLPTIADPVSPSEVPPTANIVLIHSLAQPPEGGEVDGDLSVLRNTPFTLTATPVPGWRFRCWMDGDLNPERHLLALQNASYTALFEPIN